MEGEGMTRVLVLPGDGIGREVTAEAVRVLDWFSRKRGLKVEMEERPYGVTQYRATGEVLPEQTRKAIEAADVILFGAFGLGGPEDHDVALQQDTGLLFLRRWLQLYINLRPVRTFDSLLGASSLKDHVARGVDLVIVRELIGGIYFGQPRGIEALPGGGRRGYNTQVYTSAEIRRIAVYAFELARLRRRKVCSVDKANVLESSVLWHEEVQAVHDAEYPDVELTHMLVDNAAMQLVRRPSQFDVMLTDNIFGDILSDCAAMASGSLGMLPSASLGPPRNGRGRAAIYEPIHGSAPDIAGRGVANPLGSIMSVAMALRSSFGRSEDADLLERAVGAALAAGSRTADLAEPGMSTFSCGEMGTAVLKQLDSLNGRTS
jgi:3-isopropylmalate dehydrogenase